MLDINGYPPSKKWLVLGCFVVTWFIVVASLGLKLGLDKYDVAFWIILNSGWALMPAIVLKLDVYEELRRLVQGKRRKSVEPWTL
jgi:hypothetical protein